ncbi:MFS transporter [Paenibacillus glycanilyticus]|uniref:MFS transporter n=1 Tax=Paenibacillus glycanilyticus TaxID=126569 RepID=UPI00203E5DE6|nr:MFS transporter [Paenibacillus glycanilyticus]MCM3629171.1 MFS transporter [Paenibacillus glycanilyticus]
MNEIEGKKARMSFHFIKAFNFFSYGTIAVYSTFFALYLQSIGISPLKIGALMAGGPIVSLIANPLWGYISDRTRNIRLILILMLTGNLVAMQLVFLSDSYTFIFGCMLLFFFFQMPLFSQSNSLILNSIEGTRHKFGAFRLWGSCGWAILALITGPILGQIGISRLWIVYTIMMLVAIAFAFTLPRGSSPKTSQGVNYRQMLGNRVFLVFLVIGLLLSIPNSMNTTFIGLYMAELGGHTDLVGWSAFLSSIFEIPVFLLLDRYLSKNTRTMVSCLILVSVLYALRWFLMAGAGDAQQIIFIQALHCLTFGAFYYIGTQLTALIVPSELRASGQAVYALTWGGLSGIASGFLGGYLFQQVGPSSIYWAGTGMALIGLIGFTLLYVYMKTTADNKPEQNVSV